MLLDGSVLLNKIDLVLKDDNVLELHDLHGSKVLRSLRLRAALVTCNQQECCIHYSSTVEHGSHENIVAGAVNKGDVATELPGSLLILEDVSGVGAAGSEGTGFGAVRRDTLVNLGIGISELDGNVTLKLVLEADSLDARERLDNSGLSVSHVADGTDVDGGLATDDLRGKRCQLGRIEVLYILKGKVRLANTAVSILLLDGVDLNVALVDVLDVGGERDGFLSHFIKRGL